MIKPYGWLTGESSSHRNGNLQDLTCNYEWAKEICDENNKYSREYDPDHEDIIPIPLYMEPKEYVQELISLLRRVHKELYCIDAYHDIQSEITAKLKEYENG